MFKFLLLFSLFCISYAETSLQSACDNITHAFYYRRSCFVEPANLSTFDDARCEIFPNGHLAFVLSQKLLTRITTEQQAGGVLTQSGHYVGLVRLNTTAGNPQNQSWAWVHPDGRQWIVPDQPGMILWDVPWGEPNGQGNHGDMFWTMTGLNDVNGMTEVIYSLCQYDEPYEWIFNLTAHNTKGSAKTVLKEMNNVRSISCARTCRQEQVCGSFAYNTNDRHCILHWTEGEMAGYEPIQAQGYDFWVINME